MHVTPLVLIGNFFSMHFSLDNRQIVLARLARIGPAQHVGQQSHFYIHDFTFQSKTGYTHNYVLLIL